MRSTLLHESDGQKTYALIFDAGDDVLPLLKEFAEANALGGSHFTAIGAFECVTLGYFDWQRKDYRRIPVDEQVEVISLVGDVAVGQAGGPALHVHVVLGKADGAAIGGHLLDARVRPTLEVMLTESPVHLRRHHDPATGLALIRLPKTAGAKP